MIFFKKWKLRGWECKICLRSFYVHFMNLPILVDVQNPEILFLTTYFRRKNPLFLESEALYATAKKGCTSLPIQFLHVTICLIPIKNALFIRPALIQLYGTDF